jgi:hypothetical protein
MRGSYYNEFDPKAAAWLRELIAQGNNKRLTSDSRFAIMVRKGDKP